VIEDETDRCLRSAKVLKSKINKISLIRFLVKIKVRDIAKDINGRGRGPYKAEDMMVIIGG